MPGEIIVNVPEQPAPVVNVVMPRVKRQVKTIQRDGRGNIQSTSTQIDYETPLTKSLSGRYAWQKPKAGSLQIEKAEKGTPRIVVNVPESKSPTVNIRMPMVKEETEKVVRDKRGNIDHTVTEMTYEE